MITLFTNFLDSPTGLQLFWIRKCLLYWQLPNYIILDAYTCTVPYMLILRMSPLPEKILLRLSLVLWAGLLWDSTALSKVISTMHLSSCRLLSVHHWAGNFWGIGMLSVNLRVSHVWHRGNWWVLMRERKKEWVNRHKIRQQGAILRTEHWKVKRNKQEKFLKTPERKDLWWRNQTLGGGRKVLGVGPRD
jgi:hypothetical protein